jgi:pyruvate formate lyase activating enzyme
VWFEITNLLTPGRTTPKPATLTRGREIATRNGVRYVYTGNVHDVEGGSTWCHACGQLLIARDWYRLGAWNLTEDGRCRRCGTRCAGLFDGPPEHWGPHRLPVILQRPDPQR